jgi:hypothetical protein
MRLLLVVAACVLSLSLLTVSAPAGDLPPAEANAVWNYITKVSPYRSWKQWPDYQGVHTSRSPHGKTNQVWVNRVALHSRKVPLDYGAMEVKEAYDAQGRLVSVAVMYKVKGYNPGAGDWFWALYTPEGKPKRAGKPRGCISCHGAAAGNDYVTVHRLP